MLGDLLVIIVDVIAPIFLVIGIGALVGWRFKPDPRGLSVFLIYVLVPALAFRGLATSELDMSILGGIAVVVIGLMLIMAVIGVIAVRSGLAGGQARKDDARFEGAFVLTVTQPNAANYGIPLNTFAFGAVGTQVAVVYYVVSVLIGNLVGVFFASRGQGSMRTALMNVVRVPIAYAAIAGFIVNIFNIDLPVVIDRAVDITADGAIPGMLMLLGLSLANTSLKGQWRAMWIACGLKLVISPLIALPLALIVGLQDVPFNVAILESATPVAVLASALASEFGSDASFVAATTLLSTLLSIVTSAVIILLLQGSLI